jgi:hypothetical protein
MDAPVLEIVHSSTEWPPCEDVSSAEVRDDGEYTTLSWLNPGGDFLGVRVVRKIGTPPVTPYDGELIYDGSAETRLDRGSPRGVNIYYGIYAYNTYRTYGAGVVLHLTRGVPAAPGLLPPVILGDSVRLDWLPVDGSTYYMVHRLTEGAVEEQFLGETVNPWFVDYPDRNGLCSYRIRGGNNFGTGPFSQPMEVLVEIAPALPDAPSDLNGTIGEDLMVSLSWADNSVNETGFKVERRSGSLDWGEIGETGLNKISFTDIHTEAGKEYFYRVRAFNQAGYSAYLEEIPATTPDIPMAPVFREQRVVSPYQINLFWEDRSDNETGYRVEIITDGNPGESCHLESNSEAFYAFGLNPGTVYRFRITAFNTHGESSVETEAVRTPDIINTPVF